jgi:hypothetical protein
MSKTYLITIDQADLETIIHKCINRAFGLHILSNSNSNNSLYKAEPILDNHEVVPAQLIDNKIKKEVLCEL